MRLRVTSFNELKNGDMIISPIDNEVTEFVIDPYKRKFLSNGRCFYPIKQFEPNIFYMYTGKKLVGEKDKEFFS